MRSYDDIKCDDRFDGAVAELEPEIPAPHFCDVCLIDVDAAEAAGADLPIPDLAVGSQLVHDGTKYVREWLCGRHLGAPLDLAAASWGFDLGRDVCAYLNGLD